MRVHSESQRVRQARTRVVVARLMACLVKSCCLSGPFFRETSSDITLSSEYDTETARMNHAWPYNK